jgi:hypothetical protein
VISSLAGGRPGGLGGHHFAVTKRRRHRNNLAEMTIRQARRGVGSIRDNAASVARSDHANRGVGFAGRNTATPCRNASVRPEVARAAVEKTARIIPRSSRRTLGLPSGPDWTTMDSRNDQAKSTQTTKQQANLEGGLLS